MASKKGVLSVSRDRNISDKVSRITPHGSVASDSDKVSRITPHGSVASDSDKVSRITPHGSVASENAKAIENSFKRYTATAFRNIYSSRDVEKGRMDLQFSEQVNQYYSNMNSGVDAPDSHKIEEIVAEVHSLSKPYFIMTLQMAIFLSFTIGLAFIPNWKDEQDVISPNNERFWMQRVDNWPRCSDLRPQFFRLLSYSLVHCGFMHLLSNLTMMFCYGSILEAQLEDRCYLIIGIFFIGSVIGALGQSYQSPYKGIVGASSGCYSIFGFLSGLHLTKVTITTTIDDNNSDEKIDDKSEYDYLIRVIMLAHIFCDLILFTVYYDDNIAYFSHFFGWTSGLLLAMTLLSSSTIISRLSLAVFVAQVYILSSSYSYYPPLPTVLDDCCAQAFWMIADSSSSLSDVTSNFVCIDDHLYDKYSSDVASYLSNNQNNNAYILFTAKPKKA